MFLVAPRSLVKILGIAWSNSTTIPEMSKNRFGEHVRSMCVLIYSILSLTNFNYINVRENSLLKNMYFLITSFIENKMKLYNYNNYKDKEDKIL